MIQDLILSQQLKIAANEVFSKRVFVSVSFAIVAVTVLLVGVFWPTVYESSASIQWSNVNSVSPILNQQRSPSATTINEQAAIAREIILSNKILDKLIEIIGLDKASDGSQLSLTQLQIMKESFTSRIQVVRQGPKLFSISYKHKDAERAHIVVKTITDLFLEETQTVKNAMSQGAYDFIDRQVEDYKNKLEDINRKIIDFRKENADLDTDTSLGVTSRVNNLKNVIRETNLRLTEAKVQKQSLTEQLAREKETIERQLRANSFQVSSVERTSAAVDRLASLQNNLDTLRLSYTESYPDIVQLKEQIKNLKAQILAEENSQLENIENDNENSNDTGGPVRFVESILYTRLTGDISAVETTIRTLEARITDAEGRLSNELLRANEVTAQESQIGELARDLNVTQELYNDLLTRRENARVSLNLQLENQGSSFKIQEPATVPLIPVGVRYLHFVLLSVPIGLAFPIGIILALLLVDQRIRHEDSVKIDGFEIPVISVVGQYQNESEIKIEKKKNTISISMSILAILCMALITSLKMTQVIGA